MVLIYMYRRQKALEKLSLKEHLLQISIKVDCTPKFTFTRAREELTQMVDAACDTNEFIQHVDAVCDTQDIMQMVDAKCDT